MTSQKADTLATDIEPDQTERTSGQKSNSRESARTELEQKISDMSLNNIDDSDQDRLAALVQQLSGEVVGAGSPEDLALLATIRDLGYEIPSEVDEWLTQNEIADIAERAGITVRLNKHVTKAK